MIIVPVATITKRKTQLSLIPYAWPMTDPPSPEEKRSSHFRHQD
jgi:hypothetical protein